MGERRVTAASSPAASHRVSEPHLPPPFCFRINFSSLRSFHGYFRQCDVDNVRNIQQHSMSSEGEDIPEGGHDPSASDILSWIGHAIYWSVRAVGIALYYIIYYVYFAALFVLKLLWRPLEFILLPILHLLQFLWRCFLAPFQFLAKFEVCIEELLF